MSASVLPSKCFAIASKSLRTFSKCRVFSPAAARFASMNLPTASTTSPDLCLALKNLNTSSSSSPLVNRCTSSKNRRLPAFNPAHTTPPASISSKILSAAASASSSFFRVTYRHFPPSCHANRQHTAPVFGCFQR